MAEWQLVLDDRAGRARAFLTDTTFALTRRIDGGCELEGELPISAPAAAEFAIGSRRLRAYRDGVLRFHGDVDEPLTSTQETLHFIARDPWAELMRAPLVQVESFVQTDAGAIASALIETTRAAIRAGAVTPSVLRDRIYDVGKIVGDLIGNLADVDDGFHFLVQPIEYDESGARPVIAELEVRYPLAGVDAAGAHFQYGEGTLANLTSFSQEERLPRNYVLALGAVIPPTNTVERLYVGEEVQGDIGGTFTITFEGQTTAGISVHASESDIQTALEALSNVDAGDVGVSSGSWTVQWYPTINVELEFKGQYTGVDTALAFSVNTSGITQNLGGSVVAYGPKQRGTPGTSGQPLEAIAEDAASQAEHGFRPAVLSWADVIEPATLAQYAQGALIPDPPAVYEVAATRSAPALFDDFDVGDRVALLIEEGAVAIEALVRVSEATLTVGETGEELLTSLVLGTEELRRALNPSRRLFDALDTFAGRLRALESRKT